jgi:hypothetical protein
MTLQQLMDEVLARTRQTSSEASTRIGRELNDRYRRVTSSIGLTSSRRIEVIAVAAAGNPLVNFSGIDKIFAVWINAPDSNTRRVLGEITFDQWRNLVPFAETGDPGAVQGVPTMYAIERMDATLVRVVVYPAPDQTYTLWADGLDTSGTTLTPTDVPHFAVDFHDILMHGALADEWTQLKQDDLATRSESMYEQRLSELRMFIAKSAYLDIHQGGARNYTRGDYLPGYSVPPPGYFY